MKRKPSPSREAEGTAETDAKPKAASVARALKGAQTDGEVARIGRAVDVQKAGRPGRKSMETLLTGGRPDRAA